MKKNFLKLTAALAVCLVVLWLLQMLLMPKYMTESKEGNLIAEYYDDFEEHGPHDVIFIGDCEVYENFSPITLWEEYGITSYIRGSAQQLIWQSYYLMEETFEYETPKVMVFNVLSMKYDTPASTGAAAQREAYNRMTIDPMRWSMSKWNCIQASMTDMEREKEAEWMYLFPILRYHDRWSDLSAEDFKYWFKRGDVADNGYLMQTGVKPLVHDHVEKPLVDYSFADSCWEYLDRMRELCEKHGTELVLIKAPSLSPVWWDQWDAQIEEYAEKYDLVYWNFLEHQEEIGIDWNTDTYDTGLHLNVYGAEKMSRYFGQLLVDTFDLPDRRSDAELSAVWADKVAVYNERKAKLEAETASATEGE
ncbi:MAG: SGNH/GDSL hydrolase family protein [Oscillospiraceae bacterium]|nr:SGNH/GDSL hydrolase family protein [Oscillospiraceae bacterium]